MKSLKQHITPTFTFRLLLCICLALVTTYTELNAQDLLATEQIKELFDKPKRIEWIRHYTGRLGHINDVSMSIGFDGRRCKGRLIYARSKEVFLLEGNLSGNKLSLKEKDRKDQTSGYLTGRLDEAGFNGVWRNQDKEISQQLKLQRAEAPLDHPLPCATDHWIRFYRSDAHQLLVQHLGGQTYSGYISLPGYAHTFCFQNSAGASSNQLLFELLDPYGHPVGFLHSKSQEPDHWTFSFIDLQGKSKLLNFQLQDQFAMSCQEHADYLSSYDITFPQTTSTAFNKWIGALAMEWVNGCQKYVAVVGAEETNYRPEMRASLRAYAWTDIFFYDQQLISGQLAQQKSWSADVKGQAFIYDLSAERELRESDIFNPAFPRRVVLWEKLKTELPNFPMYIDKGFRQWMENNDFPHLSLCSEGLCFSTEFDMIYGQQRLIIPYKEVLPYLKKDSPVASLARKQ